jgi:hypothetical protein
MKRLAIIGFSATTFFLCSALLSETASATGKAGADGTATSYDDNKAVLLVVDCEKNSAGEWEYSNCVHELREKTVDILCKKKGKGTFKWSFQVGSEKSTLSQATTCK